MIDLFNALAHVSAFIGMVTFSVGLFGRAGSIVYSWSPFVRLLARFAMGAICMGHLVCAAQSAGLIHSYHRITPGEFVLNVGLAVFWPFTAWFHWKIFVRARDGCDPNEPPRKEYEATAFGIKRSK